MAVDARVPTQNDCQGDASRGGSEMPQVQCTAGGQQIKRDMATRWVLSWSQMYKGGMWWSSGTNGVHPQHRVLLQTARLDKKYQQIRGR